MKMHKSPVKSKVNGVSTVVGEAHFPQYDSVEEAVQSVSGEILLSVINTQVKTNAMNKVRQDATGGPSKKELQAKAMAYLAKNDVQALVEASGKGEAEVQALVERTVELLRAQAEAEKLERLKAAGASVAASASAEDDDDDQD